MESKDDEEIILKHFIDSISICPIIKDKNVKIVFPELKVKLLDSLEKTKFLNEVIERLDLKDISTVHARAEEKGVDPDYREKYDISVARAVASLPVLLEYCLPFVKVGGCFIAMKGNSTEEVENSKKALEILGDIKRNVIVIKKENRANHQKIR